MTKENTGWKEAVSYIALFVAIITITAFVIIPVYWPSGFVFWLVIVFAGTVLLVNWHSDNFKYKCKNCGNYFEISAFRDFISPHGITRDGGGWKYLKCPKCKKRSRAVIVEK